MSVKSTFDWCRRYITLPLLGVICFLVYVLFFNENSFMDRMRYNDEIERLKAEIRVNRDTLEYYRSLNRHLNTDPATMERIVREYYHMQRPNEDVYVFE